MAFSTHLRFVLALSGVLISFTAQADDSPVALKGTQPLTMEGDIAAQLVDGVDKFLLREIDKSVAGREKFWKRDFSSAEAYSKSIEPNRQRLAHILGVRDPRVKFDAPELVGTTEQPALIAKHNNYDIFAVRWPAFADVHGEGLLLVPTNGKPVANIIAIPDADQTPEQICGLADGIPTESQFARRLAECGCRVIVPTLISREKAMRAPPGQTRNNKITSREFIYRSAFELGRHVIGYEVQKVLACADWFERESELAKSAKLPLGTIGYGEGGMLALYSAAIDTRIDVCASSGYFGSSSSTWKQPLDRNVFGLLEQFGDAELATMILPRTALIDLGTYPKLDLPGESGAPAVLSRPDQQSLVAELNRAKALVAPYVELVRKNPKLGEILYQEHQTTRSELPYLPTPTLFQLLLRLTHPADPDQNGLLNRIFATERSPGAKSITVLNAAARQARQFHELERHSQELLRESEYVRKKFMEKLNTSSLDAYKKTVEDYRTIFRNDVIGSFDHPLLPFNARSRKKYDTEKFVGYEVVLDVWEDVIAYGILLLPKDMKPGEKRPVVVCQHGLEGRPTDVIEKDHPAYHDFAAKLCERGFITFSPQNLYIGQDRFRTLQRKANPLKKTLFSVIVPQHQQIVNWLKTQPSVDPERIAFYGLSYGGKSAMRIPPLVTDYCLSICSADFNEWVAKNASTRLPFSYMWTGEYEIFEWDLGSTFNYAEMAALIAPRPFMVERGHTDGVSEDEYVAFEFGKVFNLYSHRLKLPDHCVMEVFDGPHTINGKGTFDFLHKHLKWPKK